MLMDAYISALEEAGLRRSIAAGLFELHRTAKVHFSLTVRGRIKDVNFNALRALSDLIRQRCSEFTGALTIGPEDEVEDQVALVLEAEDRTDGPSQKSPAVIDETTKREITRRLCSVFSLGWTSTRDVIDVLSRFSKILVNQAKHDNADQFSRTLEVQTQLIELRLKRVAARRPTVSFHRAALPDFLGSFEYIHMARGVIDSGDRDKTEALLQFAARVMFLAIDYRNSELFKHASDIFEVAYAWTRDGHDMREFVSESIDSYLYMVLAHFNFRHESRRDTKAIEGEMPVLIRALAWVLRLLKIAIESREMADARHFHSRIFEWDKHHEIRGPQHLLGKPLSAEIQTILGVHSYAGIVLAAWALRVVGNPSDKNEVAAEVLSHALTELGTRHDVLGAWHWASQYQCDGDETSLNRGLGIELWSREGRNHRLGETQFWCGASDAWVEGGLIAGLLARPTASKLGTPQLFPAPEGEPCLDMTQIERRANDLLNNDFLRRDVLGIEDAKKDDALKETVTLFEDWWRRYKVVRLESVVNADIADDRVGMLRNEIIENVPQHRDFLMVLKAMSVCSQDAPAWIARRAVYLKWIWKEPLTTAARGQVGLGRLVAEDIGRDESMGIAYAAEKLSTTASIVSDLNQLPDVIRQGIQELSSRGYKPSVLVIPNDSRFIKSVSGSKYGVLPNCQHLGVPHVGTWEGCEVLRCPYKNTASVVVLDALAFYGAAACDVNSDLRLSVANPAAAEHCKLLDAAKKETDPAKITDREKICIVADVRLPHGVGIRDAKAAIRIDLDLSKLGFAMQESDQLYHKPNCRQLKTGASIHYSLYVRMDGDQNERQACSECNPDE